MQSIVRKAVRPFTVVLKGIILTLIICATGGAWADFQKTNPVTGETENYTWKFTGTDTWNGTENWQNSDGNKPSGTPAKSGANTWEPILFDNKDPGKTININAHMSVEGWNLRMGLYNGANVTMNTFVKYQGDTTMWMTVDENSQLTISGFGGGNIADNKVIKLSVAKANGITWNVNLASSGNANNTFEYYLKGAGSVSYKAVSAANHKIRMADVTLTGTSQVSHKTLVSFTSATPTFTADATIKLMNGSTVVATKAITAVNTTATLTTDNAVGTCELVQTSTGIDLYWVDGDPAALTPTVYKPSININFTHSGNSLSTGADVGLGGYAIPGTSWNNLAGSNGSLSALKAADSSGATYATAASVAITEARGSYSCSSLTSASDLRHGYIDESTSGLTPTITVSGIPYEKYRVIVYTATDAASKAFGYLTINGKNYTYVNSALTEGTTAWGASGGQNTAEPMAEGVNVLVSPVTLGSTLTVVGHRNGNDTRGCIAAVQIVEYVPEVVEGVDLVIPVMGDMTYTVSEAKTLSGTVYLGGNGTLTLDGSEKITAATIDVGKNVVLNINADRLDATTFTGLGTVVYDGVAPTTGKGWTDSNNWGGTVWIKNQTISSFEGNQYGNAGSTIRFTGVTGFLQTSSYNSSTYVHSVPLELVDEGNTVAFTYNNGWAGSLIKIESLKGTGTLKTEGSGSAEHIYIVDASGFSGVFNLTCKYVYVGGSQPDYSASTNPNGKLEIRSGVTMTVPSGKTWTANGGFVVNGTLNVDGTLASSASSAVSGAGTVVFTGRAPMVSGNAWWKNTDWTGTVQVKDVANMVGDNRTGTWLQFNEYGNSGSVVEMNNVTGWLPTNFTCIPKLKVTGSLYLNNGGSNKANAFKVGTLLGSGTISGDGSAPTVVFNVTDDWSGFTGTLALNNKCIVFGKTIPDSLTQGTIYVSEGAVVTPQQSSGTWWAVGGIKVDGELRAPNLGKFGGGTTITTSDNGVFTLTDSNNTDDKEVSYARITGTGTLRYADVSGKWRALSKVNFPTGMICENNLSAGLILTTQGDNTIGSLAGSGQMRSDWGGSGNTGDRNLLILQARDTTYSGVFASSNDRVRDVYVKPGVNSSGTLTLSGTQTASNGLIVESDAKVKITGTWKGATTVKGSLAFGGAGKVDGAVTTSDGSTLDYTDATGTDHITGALTLNAGTTIKFPNGAKFPYKLAGSITYDGTEIAAAKYTVGGVAGTYPLSVNTTTGEIDVKASASISESGETISWSNLSWTASESDGLTIAANESRTLALGSATAGRITFNVAANKTLTLTGTIEADEICVTGEGVVHCSAANTLQGVITGGGTVEYPEHLLPTMADWTSEDWEGTLVLRNCGREQNVNYPSGETHGVVRFDLYGSAKSVIRAPGYKGISAVADQNTTCPATLFIDAGETVEFNHGTGTSALNTHGAGFRFAKLTGTGTLRLDGTSDTAQYIFDDVKGFAGTVEITFPETGGRKSFLFGAKSGWDVMNYAYAANLVILDDMTVAAGKTWDIPAGVIIGSGKTLTLGNGATVKALSKDTEGTIAVPAGTSEVPVSATLQGISNAVVNAKLTIGDNATLNITDPSLTTLTIPADSVGGTYVNAGTLDLSGTAIKQLHLVLGATNSKDFDATKIKLPSSCGDIYYDIGAIRDLNTYTLPNGFVKPEGSEASCATNICFYATETVKEYANGGFEVTNVVANADVWLMRRNGTLLKAKVPEAPDTRTSDYRVYDGGRSFAGAACWHEWDFEQVVDGSRLGDTGKYSAEGGEYYDEAEMIALSTVAQTPTYQDIQVAGRENMKAISSTDKPYALVEFAELWSAAVRCTMPSTAGEVAIAFGDVTTGILGLKSLGNDMVELFNWMPTDGGTSTTLAQLKVESASSAQHIYVLRVTKVTENETTKRCVALYRDGEFIHEAEFNLASAITQFKVGDVCGTRGELQNLPGVANGGAVDYIRLYDRVLPEADIAGLSVRRPFVSAIDMYERTASLFEVWSATDAWTKKVKNNGGTELASEPGDDANVTLKAAGALDINLNIDSDAHYGTLIFDGSGAVALDEVGLYQTSNGCVSAEMFVVRRGVDLTVDYDAVNLSGAVVGVAQGAVLAFNFANYPFDAVTAVTTITLAGNVRAVLYDTTCKDRFSVILPDSLPAHITSAVASWDGTSYKITITPNHTAGGSVYYKDGALAAGMTVYTDAALTTATKLFAGDTLVISDDSSTGDVSVDDTFNGNISVTRAAVSLTSTGTAALASRTVTVADNCTVNFADGNFGAMTLAKAGTGAVTFAFTDDTTVASLSGSVGITVADGKTLTLGSATPFVSGGVGGTGTVKLPTISGSIDFNTYGNANSTVEVTGVTAGELTSGGACNPALLIDAAATFVSVGTYAFAKISGSGNLTFPAESAVTISDLVDYTGTVANNSSTAVTVTKLTKKGVFVGGDVLLTKYGSGTVTISSVEVGGVAKHGEWFGNDFCLVAAEYNGTKYKTIAEAITEAGDANLDAITIYENTETLDARYAFVTEDNVVKVVLKPFAVYISDAPYYETDAQSAVIRAGMALAYQYIEVLVGGTVDIPLNILTSLKIKNTGGATLNFTGVEDDCSASVGETTANYTVYTQTNKATAYTWTGAAFDSTTGDPDNRWAAKGNWSYVNSSSATVPASRQPQAGDTVAFSTAATVTLGGNVTVDSVTCGAPVTFGVDGSATLTASTGGIVLTDAAASITVSGVTLSPTPTSGVQGMIVQEVPNAGSTTYKLLKPVAEVNGVIYESLQDALNAVSKATGEVTVELRGNATLDLSKDGNALGGANVTKITIDGNDHTLNFVRSETWAQVNMVSGATLVLKDVYLAAENSANYSKTQYSNILENPNHNIAFNCVVELNNVTSRTALSFFKDASLDTVTIAETEDVYSIWIHTSAASISIKDLVVNSPAGRGIKVDDTFVSAWGGTPSATSLAIDGATFTTLKKSAVLVNTKKSMSVDATGTINISGVTADQTNLVWVDESSAAYFGGVTVTGAAIGVENPTSYVATISTDTKVDGYYTTLDAAIAAADANQVITLLKNATGSIASGAITIDVNEEEHFSCSITLSRAATLTVVNGTATVRPEAEDGSKVISTTSGSTTIYKVVYGTIFSVW